MSMTTSGKSMKWFLIMTICGGGGTIGLGNGKLETYVIELLKSHCIACPKVKEDNVRM